MKDKLIVHKGPKNIIWQGIRQNSLNSKEFLMVGTNTSNNTGYLSVGRIDLSDNKTYTIKINGATSTSPYGVSYVSKDIVTVVGSYTYENNPNINNGFIYTGKYSSLDNITLTNAVFNSVNGIPQIVKTYTPDYTAISLSLSKYTFVHSIANHLAVGTYTSTNMNGNVVEDGFIYNTAENTVTSILTFVPRNLNIRTISAYGIVYNRIFDTYTIAGGYSTQIVDNLKNRVMPFGSAYLADYSPTTNTITNFGVFNFMNDFNGRFTHFQGVSHGDNEFTYYTSADSISEDNPPSIIGSFVKITRRTDGKFNENVEWTVLHKEPYDSCKKYKRHSFDRNSIISANSVASNNVVGVLIENGAEHRTIPYQIVVL